MKPHKILAFYLDKQKNFVPKKDSTPWLTPIKLGVLLSVGRIEKMVIFLGKVKKWKKRSVEGLWVKLTKWNFFWEK